MLPNTVHWAQYNGIQVSLSQIDEFDSRTETDPSQINRLYNHVTLRVKGVVNADVNQFGFTNSQTLTFLRRALQEPRQPLAVGINGALTIDFAGGSDAKNGPLPSNVKVYQFIGSTIMVEFTIDYWETICSSSGLIVTSNRWKQKTDIDKNGLTTLTSTGRIVIDSSKTARNADDYRNIPYPVFFQPQGFERENQSYEISEDGTILEWTIVDREVLFPSPTYDASGTPQRITDWVGSWREESSLEQGGGAVILGTLTVKAWGAKNVAKNILLLFCVRVFQSRWDQANDIIKHYAWEEDFRENAVSLTVTLITFGTKDYDGTKLQAATTRVGTTLDIYESGQPTTAIPSRGTAGLWLAIKDIVPTCNDKTTITILQSNTSNQTPSRNGEVPPTGTKTLSKSDNKVQQPTGTPYTNSHIETQTIEDQSLVQLARASTDIGTAAFYARTATPISKQIVRFEMSRLNQHPELPQLSLSGRTLLRSKIQPSDPLILPSGVDRIFTIRGEYIFGYDSTAQIGTNAVIMPAAITDKDGITDKNSIGPSSFQTGLIA